MKKGTGEEFARRLGSVVKRVARCKPAHPSAIRSELASVDLSQWSDRRRSKLITQLAKKQRDQAHLGRLRAIILIAVTDLGDEVLTTIEQSGVLLSDGLAPKTFGKFIASFLDELNDVRAPEWRRLRQRLLTNSA